MNILFRHLHRLKGRHYFRLAAHMRRDLTEYVAGEESRISICLHRAAWHMARSRSREDCPWERGDAAPALPRRSGLNGHSWVLPPAQLIAPAFVNESQEGAAAGKRL